MSGNASDYLENKLIDAVLRGQAFPSITDHYVALFTVGEGDAGGGTEVSSVGTGYARSHLVASLANWSGTQGAGTTAASSGTSGQSSNNVAINFPDATPGGPDWGTLVAFAVFDAPTGGNLLFYGILTTNRTILNGDPGPTFLAGQLIVTAS